MRILHVNTEDTGGGAAHAAQRIHKALRSIGVDSHMLVLNRREEGPHVLQGLSVVQRELHRIKLAISVRRMLRQHSPTNTEWHSLNWFDSGLADWINRSEFDVINLHWLGVDMLSVEEIGRIHKPIVWTMHDMWPFSGAEHYDDLEYPGRYRDDYNSASRPPNQRGPDLDAWVWRRKRAAWAGKKFNLVSPSRWLGDCAAHSSLMRGNPCTVIPNCLDTRYFQPVDRDQARGILGLDPHKRYVLFGAMSSTSNRRKGFHLLQPALQKLAAMPGIAGNTELLVFGAHAPVNPPDFGLPVRYLGTFYDEISLALLYSAANVFAAPSMMDNLPNTVLESLACGTSCVAFDVGGMCDLIRIPDAGRLIKAFDMNAYAQGLHEILTLNPENNRKVIAENIGAIYSPGKTASAYLAIYQNHVESR